MSKMDAVKQKSDRLVSELNDIASLIGKRTGETVLINGVAVASGMGLENEAEILRSHAHHIYEGIFFATVMGEFKHGKSTLINAIVGEDLLPAAVVPATAIITMLVRGAGREVRIYYKTDPQNPDNPSWNPAKPVTISWAEFKKEFKLTLKDQETFESEGRATRFDNVIYAEVTTDNPIAEGGVRIVDSPGLKEAEARTATTMGFLSQSQAVIMLLSAARILSSDEKRFIEEYLEDAVPSRVFFLVNRFDQVTSEDGREEVREFVRQYFTPMFSAGGRFDEDLYARRVFFVSGQEALEARQSVPIDGKRLERSGVPRFEQELAHFLSSDERWTAATDAIFQQIGTILNKSNQAISDGKRLAGQTLEVLEQRRSNLAEELQDKVKDKEQIEETIRLTSELVQSKLYSSLQQHVDELEKTWPSRGMDALPALRSLSLPQAAGMIASKQKQDEFARRVTGQIQPYIEGSFKAWATAKAPVVVGADLTRMQKDVETRAKKLLEDLDRIMRDFTQDDTSEPHQRIIDASLKDIIRELGDLAPDASKINVIGPFLKKIIQQIVFNVVLLITTHFIFPPLLILGIFLAKGELNKQKALAVEQIGTELFPRMRQKIGQNERSFKSEIAASFSQIDSRLMVRLQAEIDQVQKRMDDFIEEKRQDSYDATAETDRLEQMQGFLRQRARSIAEAVGRQMPSNWVVDAVGARGTDAGAEQEAQAAPDPVPAGT